MDKREIELLKFRRQYLIAPEKVECPFMHEMHRISDQYYLYAHTDLRVTNLERGENRIILLGDIFDFEYPARDNSTIIDEFISHDFNAILEMSAKYSGRFALLYVNSENLMIFHDAMAARKIFYSKKQEKIWIASQSHLLAKVLHSAPTAEKSKIAYFASAEFKLRANSYLCDSTYYDDILQLIPNHFLDIKRAEIVRYWPNSYIWPANPKDIYAQCAKMIKGFMEAIALRYEVMLPVTAGKDSRTLLAGSYNFKKEAYYYLNKELTLTEKSTDVRISRKLMQSIDLCFHLLDPYIPVDEDFQKIYFDNNPFASSYYLPIIHNYYVNFSQKVNLPGNSVTGGYEYYLLHTKKEVETTDLLKLEYVNNFEFAGNLYEKWLIDAKVVCKQYNIPILCLFYWENRLTNMLLQIQLDKDIAQEEFCPFNSRLLISAFLSLGKEDHLKPRLKIYREMIQHLWPALLKEPINPSYLDNLARLFSFLKLYNLMFRVKCRFDEVKKMISSLASSRNNNH